MYLSVGVIANYSPQATDIGFVHTDKKIKFVIVLSGHLAGPLTVIEWDAVLGQTPFCRWIDGVTYLLGRDSGRLDVEHILQTINFYQCLKDKLRHRRAAYITVTNEKYLLHIDIVYFPPANGVQKKRLTVWLTST